MKMLPLCLIAGTLLVAGCEQPKPYKPPIPSSSERLFDSQGSALEKAKTVEGSIEQSAVKQRDAIDASK